MQIGNVNQISRISALNFKGDVEAAKATKEPVKVQTTPALETDKFVKTEQSQTAQKPKSSLTKKIAVGCVGLCPGLGQFVNGQWFKAIGFAVGVPVAASAGLFVGGYLGLAIAGGAYLWNVVDAVKNA